MEDSFRVRVDRVFGSLGNFAPPPPPPPYVNSTLPPSSSSSSPRTSSLWSLSDQEIERKASRKRDVYPPDSPPSPLQSIPPPPPHHLRQQQTLLEVLDRRHNKDDELDNPAAEDNQQHQQGEDWDIRSSIGLDCTLDFEDEEDEYDKVAVGRDTSGGDFLCMRDVVDVNEYGIHHVHNRSELPTSFKDAPPRDPRANHIAAKLRLSEDAQEAAAPPPPPPRHFDPMSSLPDPQSQQKQLDSSVAPKPILKNKEKDNPSSSQNKKRVSFHDLGIGGGGPPTDHLAAAPCSSSSAAEQISSCLERGGGEEEALHDLPGNNQSSALLEAAAAPSHVPPRFIPDYLRNPSRYTRYDLASSCDVDENSNRKAYMEFLNHANNRPAEMYLDTDDDEASFLVSSSQRPLTFTPKKKGQNQVQVSKDKPLPVGTASGNNVIIPAQDNEAGVCAMEEDVGFETVVCGGSSQRPAGRKYRSRIIRSDEEE